MPRVWSGVVHSISILWQEVCETRVKKWNEVQFMASFFSPERRRGWCVGSLSGAALSCPRISIVLRSRYFARFLPPEAEGEKIMPWDPLALTLLSERWVFVRVKDTILPAPPIQHTLTSCPETVGHVNQSRDKASESVVYNHQFQLHCLGWFYSLLSRSSIAIRSRGGDLHCTIIISIRIVS